MSEEKQKLPINFMVDEFMNQQLITLNKQKGGEKCLNQDLGRGKVSQEDV